MNDITFIIKTFRRPECLYRLLDSIKYQSPIIVLNDDVEPLSIEGIEVINTEFDIGLSEGRNRLVQAVKTPYLVLLDDDFVFTEQTKIELLLEELKEKDLDLVAGKVGNGNWEGTITFSDGVLTLVPGPNEQGLYDYVYNFFLAKTDKLKDCKWDSRLKMGEHSVRGDQCVTIRRSGEQIDVLPISDLVFSSKKKTTKESSFSSYKKTTVEVWTENGWRKIKNVYIHKCREKMVYLRSRGGTVECTEHHSLVVKGQEKKPKDIGVGGNIETYATPQLLNKTEVNSEFAWAMGFFLAEGCVSKTNKKISSISITNQKEDELMRFKQAVEQFGVSCSFVKKTERKDNCWFLHIKNTKVWVNFFDQFYTKDRFKKIPSFVFNWGKVSRSSFLEGFFCGDGDHRKDGIVAFSQKSSASCQGLIHIANDIYPYYSVNKKKNEFGEWYQVYLYKEKGRSFSEDRNVVKKLEYYNYDGFVYDIEVDSEEHSFLAGVGNVNVHNTDFFFNHKGKLRIGYRPDVAVAHKSEPVKDYDNYRNRAHNYIYDFLRFNNIKKYITHNKITYEL